MNNKAHTQYKLKSGTLIPGVTTVLNILGKQALIEWAYQCGLKGIDYHKVRDTAGDIGTLTHYLIMCEFKGETPNIAEYSPANLEKARNCLRSYHMWLKNNPIKPLMVETPLISEKYAYGGTPDIYGELNGNVLVDFKTGKGIYESFFYQLGAYGQLLLENTGKLPDRAIIVRIGKDNNDDLEIRTLSNLERYFEVFRHCLCIYKLQQELN